MGNKINKENLFLFPNYLGNYGDETKRDFHKEYLGFTLIKQLYDMGVDFIDKNLKNEIKITMDEFSLGDTQHKDYLLGYKEFPPNVLFKDLSILRYDFRAILL